MAKQFSLVIAVALASVQAFAVTVQFNDKDSTTSNIVLELKNSDYQLKAIEKDGHHFTQIVMGEGRFEKIAGAPELPTINRIVAVDPSKSYQLKVQLGEPEIITGVELYPYQPDRHERDKAGALVFNSGRYQENRWLGSEAAALLAPSNVGGLTVQTLKVMPFQFNPGLKTLKIYKKIQVSLVANKATGNLYVARKMGLNAFERAQLSAVLNAKSVLSTLKDDANKKAMLVVTSEALLPAAKQVESLHPDYKIIFKTVTAQEKPENIRAMVKTAYTTDKVDSVLLVGDENHVPFMYWDGNPSDSYYTYIIGDDNLADVRIGRFPAAKTEDVDFLVKKTARFLALQATGANASKKVMLVAHNEEYPGKYTKNMEDVRNGDNPRGLVFSTQYGGEQATNAEVVKRTPESYAIINYRGHGSESEWWEWDKNNASFTNSEVNVLENFDKNMAVFFNIACDTGAFQNSQRSLSEDTLFAGTRNDLHRGAIVVLGATQPSYTDINHRFDINLFKYIQEMDDISVGNLVALANNKIVADDNGEINDNIKMYVLFGDPLVAPSVK